MKAINSKLQKAGLEVLAVLVITFAACFSINAQGAGFENRYSDNDDLASNVLFKHSANFSKGDVASAELEYFAESLVEESESDLTVESWMTDATYFEVSELETENEEALEVEDWMSNENLFKAEETEKTSEQQFIINIDRKTKTIAVTFPGVQFGRRTWVLTEMEDPKMELEQWMVDRRVWIRKM